MRGGDLHLPHDPGRPGGEKLDTDMLNQALDAVVGKTISAQRPDDRCRRRASTATRFDNGGALAERRRRAGFRTLNGSPVTAEKIRATAS
jgi:hypothetical protein